MHYFTYLHPSAVNQNDNFYDLISGEQSARITEKWFLAVKCVVDGTKDWETSMKHVWHFIVIQWDSDKVYRIKPYKFWPCASFQTLHCLVAVQCWSYFKVTSDWVCLVLILRTFPFTSILLFLWLKSYMLSCCSFKLAHIVNLIIRIMLFFLLQ